MTDYEAPISQSSHRKSLKRCEDPFSVRFLTFSCDQRKPYLGTPEVRDRFVMRLLFVRAELHFDLYEWVVMPNHVHLLMRPKLGGQTVSKVLERLKTAFARQEVSTMRREGTAVRRFWLPGGGYDRNVVTLTEYAEKAQYIVNNPVSAGLVGAPEDWVWSSAGWPDQSWRP